MRLLVTGSRGQLGSSLTESQSRKFEIIGSARKPLDSSSLVKLDITDLDEVVGIVSRISPDVVINTAALTNVDHCEDDRELAMLTNAKSAENLAMACKEIGAKMIQISTDYVFDGMSGMYNESSPTSPIQEYGRTKLEGERRAIDVLGSDLCIVRTSVVFDGTSKNFVTWVIDSLKSGSAISIVQDQWVCPTSTRFLTKSILNLVENGFNGIINVSSSDRISRFEMAQIIAEKLGLDFSKIMPIGMDDLEWKARRPRDSSLDISLLRNITETWKFEDMLEKEFQKR